MSNAVPNGWNITTLGEFATVKGGKRLPKGETFSESKTPYPYIRVTDFNAGTIEVNNLRYVTNDIREKIKRYTISSTDLYISIAGTLGLIGEIPCSLNGALLTENAAKIIFNDIDKSDKVFFKYYLSSGDAQDHLHQSKGTGGGVPKLALFRIEDTPVLSPPLPEQQKIAAILSSVDEVIEKTQAQINKLKDLKTGMMQELLSPREGQATNINNPQGESKNSLHHTEFKDSPLGRIPVGWETCTVESITTDVTYGLTVRPKYIKEGVPLVSGKECKDGWLDFSISNRMSQKDYDGLRPRSLPKVDDIIMTKTGTIGRVALVRKEHPSFAISQNVALLTPNKIKVNPNYLELLLTSQIVKEHIRLGVVTLSIPDLQLGVLKNFLIPLPNKEEQQRITTIIDSIKLKIRLSTEKLDQINSIKKALMQDLLTGKVRVKVDAA